MIFGRLGLTTVVGFAAILLAGAILGANAVALDEPRPDVDRIMKDDLLTEDGKLATDVERNTRPQPEAITRFEDRAESLFPDTPRIEAALRQRLVRPMLLAGVWVADLGTGLGYSLAATIGVGATQMVLQGSTLALIAAPCYRVYRLFTEARA